MTRKDYVKFAAVAKEMAETFGRHGHWHVVREFEIRMAGIFAADNPRFDRERFYRACEPDAEVKE